MSDRTMAVMNPVKAWAQGLPDAYLECRLRRVHTLGAYTVRDDEVQARRLYVETEQCSHCGTKRTRKIRKDSGRLEGGYSYVHPRGYIIPDEIGFIGAEELGLLRLERVRRYLLRQPAFSAR